MKKAKIIVFMLICLLMACATGYSRQPLVYKTIHKAAEKGDIAAIERHLQNGADVNVKDQDGNTPLMWATYNGSLEVVKFLVAKGVNVNARDKNNETPLMEATHEGHRNVAEFLKQHGAKE